MSIKPERRDRRYTGDEKQTERLEVRLGLTLRNRFLEACRRAGDTPSNVLRAAMADYVETFELAQRKTLRQELTMKLIDNPLKTASMGLTSLAAFAMLAAPSSADEHLFKALDSNGDGQLSASDAGPLEKVIWVLDTDSSQTVTLNEFKTIARYVQIEESQMPVIIEADKITTYENSRILFDGALAFNSQLAEKGIQPGDTFNLRFEENADALRTLVTIDLSTAGEVHFTTSKLESVNQGILADIPHFFTLGQVSLASPTP